MKGVCVPSLTKKSGISFLPETVKGVEERQTDRKGDKASKWHHQSMNRWGVTYRQAYLFF